MNYEEQQEVWIKEHNVKKGDLVFVKGPFEDYTGPRFHEVMKNFIGKAFSIDHFIALGITLENDWTWPFYCLQKLEPAKDDVEILAGAKVYNFYRKEVVRVCGRGLHGLYTISLLDTHQYTMAKQSDLAILPDVTAMCYPSTNKEIVALVKKEYVENRKTEELMDKYPYKMMDTYPVDTRNDLSAWIDAPFITQSETIESLREGIKSIDGVVHCAVDNTQLNSSAIIISVVGGDPYEIGEFLVNYLPAGVRCDTDHIFNSFTYEENGRVVYFSHRLVNKAPVKYVGSSGVSIGPTGLSIGPADFSIGSNLPLFETSYKVSNIEVKKVKEPVKTETKNLAGLWRKGNVVYNVEEYPRGRYVASYINDGILCKLKGNWEPTDGWEQIEFVNKGIEPGKRLDRPIMKTRIQTPVDTYDLG